MGKQSEQELAATTTAATRDDVAGRDDAVLCCGQTHSTGHRATSRPPCSEQAAQLSLAAALSVATPSTMACLNRCARTSGFLALTTTPP